MVSIIIPYYNRPEKLERCLNSVLKQTYQDFEILVVDDYSTVPLTLNLDSRIKIFRNLKNLGPGLSRNVGVDNTNGDFIAFLDSDDYWDSLFLQKCLEQFQNVNNNPVMVFTNTLSVSKEGSVPKRKWRSRSETILPNILLNNRPWATSACLWRADIVKSIKWIDRRNWEDYVFDVSVALINNKVSGINEFLVFYDAEGDDKLSKSNFLNRNIEWTYSLIEIFKLLKNSEFFNNPKLRIIIINNLISSLELMKRENYLEPSLENQIFAGLKELQNITLFNLVKFTYTRFDNKNAPRLLNKIRKYFYKK